MECLSESILLCVGNAVMQQPVGLDRMNHSSLQMKTRYLYAYWIALICRIELWLVVVVGRVSICGALSVILDSRRQLMLLIDLLVLSVRIQDLQS